MVYKEYLPNALLAPYIECYWSAIADNPPFQEEEALIPDGTIELMFNYGDPYFQVIDHQKIKVKGSHVIGVRSKSLWISQSANQNFFCIRFKPGGTYPFFKIPAYLFSNQFIGIDDLLNSEYKELEEKIFNLTNDLERVKLANNFFMKKITSFSPASVTSENFFLATSSTSTNLSELAGMLNVSIKTLERHVKQTSGLTPELYFIIQRFNFSIKLMYSGKYNSLTEIAYASGYADQSHFIKEFKRLTNETPLQFLKKQFKIIDVIQPALSKRLSKLYNFES